MRPIVLILFVGMCNALLGAETRNESLALVPWPAHVERQTGTWRLERTARIIADAGSMEEARRLAEALSKPLGWRVPVTSPPAREGEIELVLTPSTTAASSEGYHLSVSPRRVMIHAGGPAGLFYGGVTLRQLLPPEIFAPNAVTPPVGWKAPCIEIEDSPRFAWRGLLLDVARHFFPPEFVKKLIDTMALQKMNSLQLHLTDDQGWRIEIKKYPRLTQNGSMRRESPLKGDRNRGDGIPYGPFFYTQAQIRELVAYAAGRHVTLVPEIEIPGHFLAAVAAYPEISCEGQPRQVRTKWGIEPDILCPGNDHAVEFAKDVLAEVCELFPSRFIHIGGDEAPRLRWKTCPKCQARIKAEHLQSEAQLQTWLNHRLEEFLASKGGRLIGWDEILEGGLTPGATVMSWRGIAGGIAAARAGHDVIMSPTTTCYFDYAQAGGAGEPESIGGFIPLRTVYEYEPVPQELPEDRRQHILGAQGNIWTEFIRTPQDVEYFAFPRAVALAEVDWSSGARDYEKFLTRLDSHLKRLDLLQINYRRIEPRPPKP